MISTFTQLHTSGILLVVIQSALFLAVTNVRCEMTESISAYDKMNDPFLVNFNFCNKIRVINDFDNNFDQTSHTVSEYPTSYSSEVNSQCTNITADESNNAKLGNIDFREENNNESGYPVSISYFSNISSELPMQVLFNSTSTPYFENIRETFLSLHGNSKNNEVLNSNVSTVIPLNTKFIYSETPASSHRMSNCDYDLCPTTMILAFENCTNVNDNDHTSSGNNNNLEKVNFKDCTNFPIENDNNTAETSTTEMSIQKSHTLTWFPLSSTTNDIQLLTHNQLKESEMNKSTTVRNDKIIRLSTNCSILTSYFSNSSSSSFLFKKLFNAIKPRHYFEKFYTKSSLFQGITTNNEAPNHVKYMSIFIPLNTESVSSAKVTSSERMSKYKSDLSATILFLASENCTNDQDSTSKVNSEISNNIYTENNNNLNTTATETPVLSTKYIERSQLITWFPCSTTVNYIRLMTMPQMNKSEIDINSTITKSPIDAPFSTSNFSKNSSKFSFQRLFNALKSYKYIDKINKTFVHGITTNKEVPNCVDNLSTIALLNVASISSVVTSSNISKKDYISYTTTLLSNHENCTNVNENSQRSTIEKINSTNSIDLCTRNDSNVTITESSAITTEHVIEKQELYTMTSMERSEMNINSTTIRNDKLLTRPPIQFLLDGNMQFQNITNLLMEERLNMTNESIHTNGTMINAAGRLVTDWFGQMSKMMHCFSRGSLPESAVITKITLHLYTRKNQNISELLTFDTEGLSIYESINMDYGEMNDYAESHDIDDDISYNEDDPESCYGDFDTYEYWYPDIRNNSKAKRGKDSNSHNNSSSIIINSNIDITGIKATTVTTEFMKAQTRNSISNISSFDKETAFRSKCLKSSRCLLTSKYLNVKDHTKIIIHGYTQNRNTEAILQLKDAYLSQGPCNVILVDWAELAAGPCYNIASKYARNVGGLVSELMVQLVLGGMSTKSIHIIGFSLGAQAAGFASNYYTTGHIHRITGLDPAAPLFPLRDPDDCLDAGDAGFVDIIHTSHLLGQRLALGHVDFYPNGGVRQPGCDKADIICSHIRGLLLFTESVTSVTSFPSVACDSWEMFLNGSCDKNPVVYMGDKCSPSIKGMFYLKTNSTSPFSLRANVKNTQ